MALRPWCLRHSAVESLLSKFTLAKIKVKTSADAQEAPGVAQRSLGDAQSAQCAPWAFPGRPQGALWAAPGCLLAACWAPSGCLQCAFRLRMGFPLAHWSRLAASWASFALCASTPFHPLRCDTSVVSLGVSWAQFRAPGVDSRISHPLPEVTHLPP